MLQAYTEARESPPLVQSELHTAQKTRSPGMDITANSGQREVVASIEVDDGVMLDLSIVLPACYPLQAAEVCTQTPPSLSPCHYIAQIYDPGSDCASGCVMCHAWVRYAVLCRSRCGRQLLFKRS